MSFVPRGVFQSPGLSLSGLQRSPGATVGSKLGFRVQVVFGVNR